MRYFFCGYFLLFIFHVCLYYTVLFVPYGLVFTCWERADLLALLYVMFSCVFVTLPYVLTPAHDIHAMSVTMTMGLFKVNIQVLLIIILIKSKFLSNY